MAASSSSTWSAARSSSAVDSVNTSIDSFAYSPASSSCDIIYIDQFCNVAPAMARTLDWVDDQSPSDEPSTPKATAKSNAPVTPPPRNAQTHRANDNKQQYLQSSISRNARRVYDIPTLLELRRTQRQVPVMLHVKPEAIAENIFQYISATGAHQSSARSRGLSDMSNVSRGSISSATNQRHQLPGSSKFLGLPRAYRQLPSVGTENTSFQRADGFVRFLAQHASPPHHRVTAGGRIVPAGPTSPPPMLDYASLNGIVRDRLANAQLSQKEGRSILTALRPQQVFDQATTATSYGGYNPDPDASMASQFHMPANMVQTPGLYDGNTYGHTPIVPTTPNSTVVIPLGMFPDGSTLVSYNGVNYRTYWNGVTTIMEPLQPFQAPIEQQNLTNVYPSAMYTPSQPDFPAQQASNAEMSMPSKSSIQNLKVPKRRPTTSSQSVQLGIQEGELKSQLTKLDKYMALYHYEIPLSERSELVAQRRLLVEAIDKIRTSKEPNKRSIPVVEPSQGQPSTPVSKLGLSRKTSGLRQNTSNHDFGGKGLSPAALPFVPRNARNNSSTSSRVRVVSDQSQQENVNVNQRHVDKPAPLNVKDMANLAIARKDKALNAANLTGSTLVSSYRENSTSSILDPSDPAMRVIDQEDIEYAERYLYNWNLKKKTYCTTVGEFQEAIRRVRDQARRYGCYGGQSKDPAYDAEQDLWWAICERDPIPVPAKVPDHDQNPRPWNWDDSAFNFRRNGATAPASESSWVNARNSPRLMGWDAATTEKVKDAVDVTRSYYALKGQLPSVPFRTWAYDSHGNKVESTDNQFFALGGTKPPAIILKDIARVDVAPDPRALQDLSSNAVNSRQTGQNLNTRAKLGRKKNLTEADAPQRPRVRSSHQTTPQAKGTGSSNAHGSGLSTDVQAKSDLRVRQPYVEDCPESLQNADFDLKSKNGTGSSMSKKHQACQVTADADSKHSSNEKLLDPDSKERESLLTDAAAGLSSQTAEVPSELFTCPTPPMERQPPSAPKVKMPLTSHSPAASICSDSEVRSISIPNDHNSSAQRFLRNMLKSPGYSPAPAPAPNTAGHGSSMMAGLLNKVLGSSYGGAKQPTSKPGGIATSHSQPSNVLRLAKENQMSTSSMDLDQSLSKARSSLASSSYQASGYLPRNDDSGKVQAASLYNYKTSEPVPQVRVNLPPCNPYNNDYVDPTESASDGLCASKACNIETAYHTPVSFGFDGGADAEASKEDIEAAKAVQKKFPHFDLKGVTHADFEIKREDCNNSWHHGRVEDFFQELATTERKEIARLQGAGKRAL